MTVIYKKKETTLAKVLFCSFLLALWSLFGPKHLISSTSSYAS